MTQEFEPFNLEKARAGAPIQFRNGKPVRLVVFDADLQLPLVIASDNQACAYPASGKRSGRYSDFDIVMSPQPMIECEGWVNIYYADEQQNVRRVGMITGSVQEAIEVAKRHDTRPIGIGHITWKEPLVAG